MHLPTEKNKSTSHPHPGRWFYLVYQVEHSKEPNLVLATPHLWLTRVAMSGRILPNHSTKTCCIGKAQNETDCIGTFYFLCAPIRVDEG